MKRVHLFTVIQILSILGLFAIKYASTISMMFPVMLVVMVIIRMYILERLFTKKELLALDDDLPTFKEVMQPKKKARRTNGLVLEDEEKQQLKGTAKKRNNGSVASKGQA
ncbi:anion exchange protein [Aphelenchoides avenae]|nr:anion exchange protein [Aphelenchus avenae]